MTADERVDALRRHVRTRWPDGAVADVELDMIAATIAECEAKIAAALALFLQGHGGPAFELVGHAHTVTGVVAGVPITAAFGAAADALTATIGDDPDRGRLAVMALQERSAEFAAAAEQLMARHADANPG